MRVDVGVDLLKFRQTTLDSRFEYARGHRHQIVPPESHSTKYPPPSSFGLDIDVHGAMHSS